MRRRLDDAHQRAGLGPLELDGDAPTVVPVENEPLCLLELADDRAPLVSVPPTEDPLASWARLELDLRREPLLEPLGLRQRLPDLVRRLRYHDLAFDLHRSSVRRRATEQLRVMCNR